MRPSSGIRGQASFVADALRLIGSNFFIMLVSFGAGVVLSRSLGVEGRGILAGVMVYPSLFLSLAQMGVRQSSTYYLGKRVFTDNRVVGAVMTITLFTSLVGVVVVASLLFSTRNPAYSSLIIALGAVSIVPTLVTSNCSGIMLGKRLVGQFVHVSCATELLRLLLVVTLVLWLKYAVPGALAASLCSGLVVTGYALYRVARIASLRPRADWTVIRALIVKGMAYAASLFVLTLNYSVDIALMGRFSTTAETGIYAVTVGIATLIWAVPQSITTAIFSHGANAQDEDDFSRKVARLFRVTIVFALSLGMVLAVVAPFLIPALYGSQFRPSVVPLWIILPGSICLLTVKILNMDLAGRGRPYISLWVTLPALAANVLLNLYLLPRYGARGAALSSAISYSLAGGGFVLLYLKATGLRFVDLWRYRRSDFRFLRGLRPAGKFGKKNMP